MDLFVKLYDVERDEYVFINKNDIKIVSVKDDVSGLLTKDTYIAINFLDKDGSRHFMRALEGLIYETPRVSINFDKGEDK